MKYKYYFLLVLILLFLFIYFIFFSNLQNNAIVKPEVNKIDINVGDLMIMQKYESISHKNWQIEKWHLATVADTYARPYTFLRFTPLSKEIKDPPNISAVFRGFPVGKEKLLTNIIYNLEMVECSKKKSRREGWLGGTGEIYSFPPRRLSWEVEIIDPFNGLEKFSYKDLYDTGAFYLEIEVIINKNEKVLFNRSLFEFIG